MEAFDANSEFKFKWALVYGRNKNTKDNTYHIKKNCGAG